jgi:UDP-N-acetylglucosamine 1-carboxyvinyltransferase
MDKFVIHGGKPLKGHVKVKGAKNAVLPMMAASVLTNEEIILENVPALTDIDTMSQILTELGVNIKKIDDRLILQTVDESNSVARYELVSRMRASFCLLGPLLAKRKKAKVSLPGGCVIGVRPVDLHIKGLFALGADIKHKDGYIFARANTLKGAQIYLGGAFGSTVTGTENVLMAAVLARGITVINHAACEPEVQELCILLNKMGARINGIGSPTLVIEGVRSLKGATHRIIPDRIEAATFMVSSAITGGDITVQGVRPDHLSAVIETLQEIGAKVSFDSNSVRIRSNSLPKTAHIATQPYPGFPTDLQAQFMALLSLADGVSIIQEKIYPDRFMHVAELNRMGANIKKDGNIAIIQGVRELHGAPVMASDLRASAGLILAGLAAKGVTEVQRIYHIDRGYERIEERFRMLGAEIERTLDKKIIIMEE